MCVGSFSLDVDLPSGSKPQRDDGDDEDGNDDDNDDDNDDIMDTSDKPPSSSGSRRQRRQEENPGDNAAGSTPPSKRPKPMCKHGTQSHLKSAEQRSKFAHPVLAKEEEEGTPVSGEVTNVSDGEFHIHTVHFGILPNFMVYLKFLA